MKTILSLIFLLSFTIKGFSTIYYFSSSSGNDNNDGRSIEKAFASLEKASTIKLKPSDKLLFQSGDIFRGQLKLDVQGSESQSVVIGKYGGEKRLLIDGDGNESAIFLRNPSFLTIQELEIKNWKGKYGIQFTAENAGEMQDFVLQDLNIHDVGFESTTVTEPSKSIGGICGRVYKGNKPSWWDGLIIRRVNIHNVGSCGITFGNNVNLYKIEKDDPYYKPHKNVLIEHCRIDSIVRDGIWIRQCDGAIIQNCEVSRTGMNAISNGIWFWDCLNSVMQYNEGWECMSVRGNDGAPFSIDNHCLNCTIRYSYSHDNEGPGYMIFGREGDGFGNVISNNISYNDNVNKTYKYGMASIAIVSEVKGAIIENNVVIAGDETHNILGHRNWEGYPHSVTYRNNIFIGNGKAIISELDEVMKTGTFENNFITNVPNAPDELTLENNFENYYMSISKIIELNK